MSILIFLMLLLYAIQLVIGVSRNEISGSNFWFQALVGLGVLTLAGAVNALR